MCKIAKSLLHAATTASVLGLLACSDPTHMDTTPIALAEVEDCPASLEWLPNTPPVTLFKPAPHPTTECPFYRGVWQNFLIAMQPVDDAGTPAILSYPTIDTVFQSGKPHAANRSYLGDIKQAGGRQIVIDQNGRSLYYGIHVNQAYADFIHQNHLETGKAIQAYPKDPGQSRLFFPAGVAEFKSAWQIVDEANPPADLADYVTIKTTVPTLSQDPDTHAILEDKNAPLPVTARLLAIHVVYTYPGHPEFIWGSLEHSAGTPDTSAMDGMRNVAPITSEDKNPSSTDPNNANDTAVVSPHDFLLYKANTMAKDGNNAIADADLKLDPATQSFTKSDGTSAQTSIYRMFPASKSNDVTPDGAITSLNHNMEAVFAQAALPSSDRRAHYRLLGGQWMDKPAYFRVNIPIQDDGSSPFAPAPGSPADVYGVGIGTKALTAAIGTDGSDSAYSILAGENRMSSTSMESFTQAPDSFNNCFTCHNTQAVTAKGVSFDRNFGVGAIKLLEPGLLNVSHVLSQFVLEECAGPGSTLTPNADGSTTAVCP
jgi:hypothetical protein